MTTEGIWCPDQEPFCQTMPGFSEKYGTFQSELLNGTSDVFDINTE